jgi:N-acetylglutamate synthase
MSSPAELEDVAYDLWRAPEVEELDGWRLRFAQCVTDRAKSVWPNGEGTLALDQKLARTEDWYSRRGLPTRFQLTEAARPRELAPGLLARGYRWAGDPVSVEVAAVDDVVARSHGVATVSERLDDAWTRLWAGSRSFDRHDVVRALLTGSPGRTGFARIGEVAIGRGVVVRNWFGITSMVTVPEERRRGHARAIVHALAVWARRHGATRALLQVEESSIAARALYRSVGFTPNHVYRYCLRG